MLIGVTIKKNTTKMASRQSNYFTFVSFFMKIVSSEKLAKFVISLKFKTDPNKSIVLQCICNFLCMFKILPSQSLVYLQGSPRYG